MAQLLSEDTEHPSSFQIEKFKELNLSGQHWDKLILTAKHGSTTLTLGGQDKDPDDCVVLCRYPKDEIKSMVEHLQKVLDGRLEEVGFEPSEPSFEMLVKRSGTPTQGFRVQVWFDSGNVETGFYRWDSLGMRFFTTSAHIASFIQDLKGEFAC